MNIPVVVLAGRQNVGKSSLFNVITGTKKALIDNTPGVTRDPIIHRVDYGGRIFDLVDLGGFGGEDLLQKKVENEGLKWIRKGNLILLVVDAKEGLNPVDLEVLSLLRKKGKPFLLVANKFDNLKKKNQLIEFYATGVEEIFPVSALHKIGIDELLERVVEITKAPELQIEEKNNNEIKLAIIGRPNVGKSSLVNAILREDKLITSEIPGTTRDTIDIYFLWKKTPFLLIDTPGVRRKSRIDTKMERKSSMKSIDTLERADITLLVIDSYEGITTQDLRLLNLAERRGRAIMMIFNKIDLIDNVEKFKQDAIKFVNVRYPFLKHIPKTFVSAKTGYGLSNLYSMIMDTYRLYSKRITTGQLNRFFREVIEHHSHPLGKSFKPVKFYYITQIDIMPPTFVLFTNKPDEVSDNYLKYVKNKLKEKFNFYGVPIKIILKKRGEKVT